MYNSQGNILKDIKRRNITLILNAGNKKDSYNRTLHRMQWNTLHDVKNSFITKTIVIFLNVKQ